MMVGLGIFITFIAVDLVAFFFANRPEESYDHKWRFLPGGGFGLILKYGWHK